MGYGVKRKGDQLESCAIGSKVDDSVGNKNEPTFYQFMFMDGHILIISSISMGTCMLSKTHLTASASTGEELTTSVRSQIRHELGPSNSAVTFKGATGKFQKTASCDLGLASRELDLEEESMSKPQSMELRLSLKEDEHNSGFFRVKDSSAKMVPANEDSDMESMPSAKLGSVGTHNCHFSFQDQSIKPLFSQEDQILINAVEEQAFRQLILATIHAEEPVLLEKVVFRSGEAYTGEWKGGRRHGKGQHCSPRGTYEGEWAGNKMNGKGVFQFANKSRYEGEFLDGMMHGMGKFEDKSGSLYQGEFKNDRKDGIGIEVYDHEEYYEGEWKQGYKHGQGYLHFNDGSYCKGHFMDNFIHGYAEYYWFGQKKYQGEWALNKMQGQGVMEWQDGRRYQGGYANDKMQGKGTFLYPNGETFTGHWRNNKKNGRGEYTDEKGKVIRGVWYQDRLIEEYVNISSTKRFAITSLVLSEPKN